MAPNPLPFPICQLPPEEKEGGWTVYTKSQEEEIQEGSRKRNSTYLLNSLLLDELHVIFSTYPVEPHSGVVFCQEESITAHVRKGQQEKQGTMTSCLSMAPGLVGNRELRRLGGEARGEG